MNFALIREKVAAFKAANPDLVWVCPDTECGLPMKVWRCEGCFPGDVPHLHVHCWALTPTDEGCGMEWCEPIAG
jgi:hypothetical protein